VLSSLALEVNAKINLQGSSESKTKPQLPFFVLDRSLQTFTPILKVHFSLGNPCSFQIFFTAYDICQVTQVKQGIIAITTKLLSFQLIVTIGSSYAGSSLAFPLI